MPTERYEVRAEPAASNDLRELLEVDGKIVDSAITLMAELRDNPWLGEELRARPNLRILADCRRIRFDVPGWSEKPRFRIVYRNGPCYRESTSCHPALVRRSFSFLLFRRSSFLFLDH